MATPLGPACLASAPTVQECTLDAVVLEGDPPVGARTRCQPDMGSVLDRQVDEGQPENDEQDPLQDGGHQTDNAEQDQGEPGDVPEHADDGMSVHHR